MGQDDSPSECIEETETDVKANIFVKNMENLVKIEANSFPFPPNELN